MRIAGRIHLWEKVVEAVRVGRQLLRQVLVEAERIIGIEDPEWRVDDRQNHLHLGTVGHARDIVRSRQDLQVQREVQLFASETRAVDQRRAAIQGGVQRRLPFYALAQLTGLQVEVHPEVGEEREGNLVHNRYAVLDVGYETRVAADRGQPIDGQRDLHVPQRRIGRVPRNVGSVRIGQVKHHPRGNQRVGRCRANVEATNVIFAAAVDAVERRRHLATEPAHRTELETVAENVVSLTVDPQALHWEELPEGCGRCVVLGIAANAGYLEGDVEVLAVVRADRAVKGGKGEARRHNRRHDPVQRILSRDTRPVGQRLENIERVLVEGRDAGARQRIGDTHTRHARPPEQFPQSGSTGQGQTSRGLVVVRQQGVLCVGQV